jgi:hypothetical protein
MQPSAPTTIANLLEMVAASTGRIAQQPNRPPRDRGGLNRARPARLTGLAAVADPGTRALGQLADLDPDLLLAGTALGLSRHAGRGPTPAPARTRAAARWRTVSR